MSWQIPRRSAEAGYCWTELGPPGFLPQDPAQLLDELDTQHRVERFLTDTDPEFVDLCLDTGHIAYCGGNNIEIIEWFPERIAYVHLKQVDPEVRERVRRERLPMAEAVKLGVMVEPPYGDPAMPPLLAALASLDRDIFCMIEQDLYPVDPDVPLPISARTVGYSPAVESALCVDGHTASSRPTWSRPGEPVVRSSAVMGSHQTDHPSATRVTLEHRAIRRARPALSTVPEPAANRGVASPCSDHATGRSPWLHALGLEARGSVASGHAACAKTCWQSTATTATFPAAVREIEEVVPVNAVSTWVLPSGVTVGR